MNLQCDLLPALDASALQLIHDKSVELLSTVGFRFADATRAIEIFKASGFRTDGDVVYFDEKKVEKAVATVPRSFRVRALNPANDFTLGDGTFHFSNNASPAFILDKTGLRRAAETKDFIAFLKIVSQLNVINLIRGMFDPADKPDDRYGWLIRWALEYTDKAVSGSSRLECELTAAAFELTQKEMRQMAVEGITHLVGICNPRSPLALEKGNCDFLIEQAEWGAACKISPVPIAGMTGPITLPGLIILQNAEVLAPLVLSQLIHPGAPLIYGVLSTTADMQTMAAVAAPPELTGSIIRAGVQMARYYGIPSRVDVGNTNACSLDYQAGAESALMLSNAMLSGADLMASLGSLESRGMGSLEKLVFDAGLASRMKAILELPEVPAEYELQSLVDSFGHGTASEEQVAESSRTTVEELLETYHKPEVLTPSKIKELDTIMAKGGA